MSKTTEDLKMCTAVLATYLVEMVKPVLEKIHKIDNDGLSSNELVYILDGSVVLDRTISNNYYEQIEYCITADGIKEIVTENNGYAYNPKSVKTRLVSRKDVIPAVRKKLEEIEAVMS